MRILIAGGAGYIGTVLAPRLAARGYAVTVADLGWFGNHLPREIPLVCKDVMSLTEADLTGTDVVIFLGGLSERPDGGVQPGSQLRSQRRRTSHPGLPRQARRGTPLHPRVVVLGLRLHRGRALGRGLADHALHTPTASANCRPRQASATSRTPRSASSSCARAPSAATAHG